MKLTIHFWAKVGRKNSPCEDRKWMITNSFGWTRRTPPLGPSVWKQGVPKPSRTIIFFHHLNPIHVYIYIYICVYIYIYIYIYIIYIHRYLHNSPYTGWIFLIPQLMRYIGNHPGRPPWPWPPPAAREAAAAELVALVGEGPGVEMIIIILGYNIMGIYPGWYFWWVIIIYWWWIMIYYYNS